MEFSLIEISDEEFNLFHSIDRKLYTRLVHTLCRDVHMSVQVMAFWMWLEKESKDMTLFKRLISLPVIPHLNTLADETLVCLHCINTHTFLYTAYEALVLLPMIVNDRITHMISLRQFHENRFTISMVIAKIANIICVRAFRDIHNHMPSLQVQQHRHNEMVMSMNNQRIQVQPHHHDDMVNDQRMEEIKININRIIDDGEVSPDDRTVFLTFSKGFPIAEDEVIEFFTRRFGDFIEDLIMQDVEGEEQVMYARMVTRSKPWIDKIVGGNKATYIINGKHVRARKYVKKHNHQFPPPIRNQDLSSASFFC